MRVYKGITEVHTAAKGWYNGSKTDKDVDMVAVEYIDIDETGRIYNTGTEDFSVERYNMMVEYISYDVKKQVGFCTTGKNKFQTIKEIGFRTNKGERKNWIKLIKKHYPECKLVKIM